MTFAGTAALGAVAGFTILLGLPVARIGRPSPPRMAFLNSASIGVLLFLFFDILKNAYEPISAAIPVDCTSITFMYVSRHGAATSQG